MGFNPWSILVDSPPMPAGHTAFEVAQSIRQLLQTGAVLNASGLSAYLRVEPDMTRAALDMLIRSGDVETLRPVGESVAAESSRGAGSGTYYRLKNKLDRRHAWQHALWRKHGGHPDGCMGPNPMSLHNKRMSFIW